MYLVSHVGGRQGVVVNNVGPGGIRGHLHNLCDMVLEKEDLKKSLKNYYDIDSGVIFKHAFDISYNKLSFWKGMDLLQVRKGIIYRDQIRTFMNDPLKMFLYFFGTNK